MNNLSRNEQQYQDKNETLRMVFLLKLMAEGIKEPPFRAIVRA